MNRLSEIGIVLFAFFVLFPVGLVHCLTSRIVHALSLLLNRALGDGATAHFEGLVFDNAYQPLPKEVIIGRHLVPGTLRSLCDGAWIHQDERLRVERDFYRLLRDHSDQKIADFVYTAVMATVEAYGRAEPRIMNVVFSFDEERKSPRMVRTEEECTQRPTEELFREICANAAEVTEQLVPIWTGAFEACREGVS